MSKFIGPLAAAAFSSIAIAFGAQAQPSLSDADYMAQALSAGPAAVQREARVVRPGPDGMMRELKSGTNGFTCLIMGTDKMCADANSMEFLDALMSHKPPPDKVGITYMLAGDIGASNTDPYAMGKTPDNHWIVTGPHIMIFGPPSKMLGYTRTPDPPDSKHPYMMWANTPYEHAMIPVQ